MLSEKELDPSGDVGVPKLSPDFLIETYLDHQVSRFIPILSSLLIVLMHILRVGRKVLPDV